MSKALLDKNSAAEERVLEQFAKRNANRQDGILARLALGDYAYQAKKYAEAKEQFEAARQTVSPLQDYADYYLAASDLGLGDAADAAKLLNGFETRYPSSPLAARAVLQDATALTQLEQPAQAVARLQGSALQLPQPETAFLLAEAYQQEHQPDSAVAAYRTVYYSYPTSPQAMEAKGRLDALHVQMGESYPPVVLEMAQERADRLYKAGRYRDAQETYQALAEEGSGSTRDLAEVRAVVCEYEMGATERALTQLEKMQPADPDADAERLYTIAAAYRRLERPDSMEQAVQQLAGNHPQSAWYEKALVLAANYHLVQKDYDQASSYYQKSYTLFPGSDDAAAGHWRVAWRAYRERRIADAKQLFEEHIRNFPDSPQVSAALYWLGRLMERESVALASAYYQKVVDTFPNYYYGLLARKRLSDLPAVSAASAVPPEISLDQIHRPVSEGAAEGADIEQTYRQRERLLESAWLMDWAEGEMRFVLAQDSSALWAGSEMARLEEERGHYALALHYAKQYVPSYFAEQTDELPRDTWEVLFPKPYWEQIQKQAQAAHVDQYLVAGLIRQESEFDPQARSSANARGLMQLMPSTARLLARQVSDRKARRYRLAGLFQPEVNIVYGTFYLSKVLEEFNGTVEYALAAYNAGENRVHEWLQEGPYADPAEFVESIPFTETRDYVEAVLRNTALYRQLYSNEE